jgi:polyhydroxybutyrate depolymerase
MRRTQISIASAALLIGTALIVWIATSASPAQPSLAAGSLCSPARPHTSGTTVETISTADGVRSYRLHVPPSYTGLDHVPLLLNFHGFGSNANAQEVYSGLSARSDEADGGFIVVHPEGKQLNGTGPQYWNSMRIASPEPDDVAFIETLLDALESQLCIDTDRIYSTGMSNGGLMSSRLGCSLSSRIAAIAPVAGAVFPPAFTQPFPNDTCPDTRAVPLISFHGTDDTSVPFNGGTGTGGLTFRLPIDDEVDGPDVMSEWAAHNGCSSGRQKSTLTDEVDVVEYTGCTDGATVRLYIVNGGGHTWPGSFDVPGLGYVTQDISATDLIWEFFQLHPFGEEVLPTPTPTPKDGLADTDGDTVTNGTDTDDDNDGCSDTAEAQVLKGSSGDGGRRNAHFVWDFFDTPGGPPFVRDRQVSGIDFFGLLARFGASGDAGIDPLSMPAPAPAYHPAYDRTVPLVGDDPWDTQPADGAIAGTDFFLLLTQFGHSCV